MKIVTQRPEPVENFVIITVEEIIEFQRIGSLLAQVADKRLDAYDSKVSVEADGFMRVLKEDAFESSVVLSSSAGSFIEYINELEPLAFSVSDDDDDDEDAWDDEDEDDDAVDDEYIIKGRRVITNRDILVSDMHPSEEGNGDIIIPAGTIGVILTNYRLCNLVQVSFRNFDIKPLDGTRIREENNLSYPIDALDKYGCDCESCAEYALEDAKTNPHAPIY